MNDAVAPTVNVGFRLVKTHVEQITPELARHYRDMEPSPTERPLDEKRLEFLKEKIQAGLAVTFNFATAKLRGHTLRMNGQHSSHVLAALDGEMPPGLWAHIDDFEVDDEVGQVMLFRQYDTRMQSRSSLDVAGAYWGSIPELRSETDRKIAKLAAEAINWWKAAVEGVPFHLQDDRYMLIMRPETHGFIKFANSILNMKTPELTSRIQTVAAIYATHKVNEPEAVKFWTEVAKSTGAEEAQSTALDEWLKAAKEAPKNNKKPPKPGEHYQGCIYAWNNYREGKRITSIKYDVRKGFLEVHD